MLALLATLLLGQSSQQGIQLGQRGGQGMRLPALKSAAARDLFALLPGGPTSGQLASGVLTGSKGEATSTQRATSMLCQGSSGLLTVAHDLPCVEASGLLVQRGHANQTSAPSAIDNSSIWQRYASGVSNPIVTADQAVAPDGTTTADRFDLPAVNLGNGDFSAVINGGFNVSNLAFSCWAKGVSTGGTVYLFSQDFGNVFVASACTYTSGAWRRCVLTTPITGGGVYVNIGVRNVGVQSSQPAQSVYLWGCDVEDSPYPHSTINAQTNVSADGVGVAVGSAIPGASGKLTLDFTPLFATPPSLDVLLDARSSGQGFFSYVTSTTLFFSTTTGSVTATGVTWVPGQTYHLAYAWGPAGTSVTRDGTTLVGNATSSNVSGYNTTLYLGGDNTGGNQLDGYLSNLRVNP